MRALFYLYFFLSRLYRRFHLMLSGLLVNVMLADPRIDRGKRLSFKGLPVFRLLGRNAKLVIGNGCRFNDGNKNNFIGRDRQCLFTVGDSALIKIGDNVGMSSTAIVARDRIIIGNNVRIGGNVVIYDTDFHSLNLEERLARVDCGIKTAPVIIEDNVFIGAHSTILKGVTIGVNSVIGACSVVTKDVPANQIWAGNPARFIRALD